jgi:hypothetical protein
LFEFAGLARQVGDRWITAAMVAFGLTAKHLEYRHIGRDEQRPVPARRVSTHGGSPERTVTSPEEENES